MNLSPRAMRRSFAALALTAAVLGTTAAGALAAYDPSDPAQKAQHDQALSIGTQAYQYGLPALDTSRVFSTNTSVNVCDNRGNGPVNQFCSFTKLADPLDRTVVAPNHDTLYSNAWLDLTGDQPIVVHVPNVPDRFHSISLYDTFTNNFATIGTSATFYPDSSQRPFAYPDGDYVIAGPAQDLSRVNTRGLPVIRAATSRVWVLGRTLVRGESDVADVNAITAQYTTVPLNKYGKKFSWDAPKKPDTTLNVATIPGTQPGQDPIDFFDALGDQLATFPPPAADQPALAQFATVGIGPGLHPSATQNDAVLAGLREAVTAGPASVQQTLLGLFQSGFNAHNGWLVQDTGQYGTNYSLRAVVDKIGLGALDARIATYPFAQTDRLGQPLTGQKRYVAHLPAAELPVPVNSFWSLTLYDKNQFFVPNSADRYLLNDRSDLHYNADGSLDIYLQPDAPSDPDQLRNWLPTPRPGDASNPTQQFNLLMRLYDPQSSVWPGLISGAGWKAPTVLPCDSTGHTSAGWACAS